jgi:excisionase family DNA binding protein
MNEPLITDRIELLEREIAEMRGELSRLARRQNIPQYLTAVEVAEMFQVSRGTIDNWVSSNQIPYRKIGGATRFLLSELDGWTKKRPRLAQAS